MKTTNSIQNIQRVSLRDQVYQALKNAIISLELSPGQKIKDMELAERFNVSRTPVREALKRLEDEGLVISTPGSLTRVSEINTDEVKQTFVVVATLHELAASLAVANLTEEDFQLMNEYNFQLEAGVKEGNLFKAVEADDLFHGVFLKASNNVEIEKVLERLLPKIRRLEFVKFNSIDGMGSVKDHEQIIQTSKEKHHDKVVELVKHNWLSLGNQLI
ncbi:GntR family transcriptional regulator [Salinibacillus xinjiangensis]|uniref:GntR family transcriptional regulator n=1 Tax=Salinibacillus xinjiangensis TaxID=1229268 RepID=A0A6G1X4M2_9BACI|nr:GntR family transcriptional regulator [Salinibacillus xinjiangensis]MRG85778.1 GntR family transcriptional regulator [Salinibacillus xinjiangensis]